MEEVFECYGFQPDQTPIICYYDVLASKYAGGAEILKEVYRLNDQGQRELALRYDLTVPFCRMVEMNPDIRLPYRRYEIGRVFRDGPVKTGRLREFMQCDVDVVGSNSLVVEAELIAMAAEVFARLELDVFIAYNNRKLLNGIMAGLEIPSQIWEACILVLDKLDKIAEEDVRQELMELKISMSQVDKLFALRQSGAMLDELERNFANPCFNEGALEIREIQEYLELLGVANKTIFQPFLARGLSIYTGTVYEVFVCDQSFNSSLAAGGRYDQIIGAFINNGREYPAAGISFGLDAIFQVLRQNRAEETRSLDFYIVPLGTLKESLKIAQELRQKGIRTEVDISGRKLKKALEYANREGLKKVLILGENELASGKIRLKYMQDGREEEVGLEQLIKQDRD